MRGFGNLAAANEIARATKVGIITAQDSAPTILMGTLFRPHLSLKWTRKRNKVRYWNSLIQLMKSNMLFTSQPGDYFRSELFEATKMGTEPIVYNDQAVDNLYFGTK